MNWLLRALGLAFKESVPEPPAPPVDVPRSPRAGMGLQVLRGMPVLTAAKRYQCAYGTALRAAKRELERTPGYDAHAYDDFLCLGPQVRSSRATNMRRFYEQLRSKQVQP